MWASALEAWREEEEREHPLPQQLDVPPFLVCPPLPPKLLVIEGCSFPNGRLEKWESSLLRLMTMTAMIVATNRGDSGMDVPVRGTCLAQSAQPSGQGLLLLGFPRWQAEQLWNSGFLDSVLSVWLFSVPADWGDPPGYLPLRVSLPSLSFAFPPSAHLWRCWGTNPRPWNLAKLPRLGSDTLLPHPPSELGFQACPPSFLG